MRVTILGTVLAAMMAATTTSVAAQRPARAQDRGQRQPAPAPTPASPDHFALGVAARQAFKPAEALQHFQAVLAADSLNFAALCQAALAAADIVRQRPDDKRDPDGYYLLGSKYARRAIAIDSTKAEGHFLLALTLGYDALGKAPENRLDTAEEIWREVHKAIALNPTDDRAYHVLGRWHAELARFSWAKLIIRMRLHELTDSVSWDAAAANMERAVQLAPKFVYHHLDLAQTYLSMKRPADARAHLLAVDSLPVSDVRDPIYKDEAKKLLPKAVND